MERETESGSRIPAMPGQEEMVGDLALDMDTMKVASGDTVVTPAEHIISIETDEGVALTSKDDFEHTSIAISDGSAKLRIVIQADVQTSTLELEKGAGNYAECRICQEEDELKNLESPCACNGSLKYAHRKCIQRWCDEKGHKICEICHQGYHKGYKVNPRPPSRVIQSPFQGQYGIVGSDPLVYLPPPRALAVARGLVERFVYFVYGFCLALTIASFLACFTLDFIPSFWVHKV